MHWKFGENPSMGLACGTPRSSLLATDATNWTAHRMTQGSHWLLVTGIKVFSRIFKVNVNIFQGYIWSNSLIYVSLKKSGPLTKLWKGHIKCPKIWLHIKFKDFSRTFFNFSLSRTIKTLKMNQFFQGFSRFFKDVGALWL